MSQREYDELCHRLVTTRRFGAAMPALAVAEKLQVVSRYEGPRALRLKKLRER
jgi:hypothetical protein